MPRHEEEEIPSRVISLNVGGTSFATTRQTLMKYPDSLLAKICSTDVHVAKDSNGAYFIDRDPELFRLILNYLRTGYLRKLPPNHNLEDLEIEADYFGLSELLGVIREGIDDDNGSREVIIFDAGNDGEVSGPAMAVKLNKKSTHKYHFRVSASKSLRFLNRDYYPYFVNSMGCSLYTNWPELHNAVDYERKGTEYVKVYLHELLASDLRSWLPEKRSVLFYVLGRPGHNLVAMRGREPSIRTMMEIEEKVLKDWAHYFSISQQRTSIVFKITE